MKGRWAPHLWSMALLYFFYCVHRVLPSCWLLATVSKSFNNKLVSQPLVRENPGPLKKKPCNRYHTDLPLISLLRIIWTTTAFFYLNGRFKNHYAPFPRKRAISIAFVCPSVHPSVCQSITYMVNNSRTQRPSMPKFGK